MQDHKELIIRRGDPTNKDYEDFARLINATMSRPITGDTMRQQDNNKLSEDILQRYAACINDNVIGYGVLYRAATAQKPTINAWLTIEQAYRKQGLGTKLYQFLSEKASAYDVTQIASYCSDEDVNSFAFAQKRGFDIRRHIYESILDLTTFDVTQWLDIVEEVRSQGIRFSSLAQEGNTQAALFKLYQLNAETAQDNPTYDGTYKQTFENFKAKIANAHWFRADGQWLAIDGDRYIGLGAIGFEEDGITASNAFTGVDREYRGRKIALALKVVGAKFAQEQGATRLITTNDSANAPMLAINQKLGYQRTVGEYLLRKSMRV